MKNTSDLRVMKTEKAIIEAFLKLLSEKLFESVTISDICQLAIVRRATFYNHFTDKYELFTRALQYIQGIYFETLSNADTKMPKRNGTFLDTLQISLDYIEQNSRLFTSIAQSRYADMLIGLVSEQLSREIKKYIEKEVKDKYIGEISSELTVQLLTGALIQAAGWWFFNRNKISKEEITKEVTAFIQKTISE